MKIDKSFQKFLGIIFEYNFKIISSYDSKNKWKKHRFYGNELTSLTYVFYNSLFDNYLQVTSPKLDYVIYGKQE